MSTTDGFSDELEGWEKEEVLDAPHPLTVFREPYELKETPIHSGQEELPLFVPMPKDQRVYGRANLNMGKRYVTDYHLYDDEDESESPKPRQEQNSPGGIEETADQFSIRWRVRGESAPTEAELARLIAKASRDCDGWGRVMTGEFYRDLISPYVARTQHGTPFEWAYERARLAIGFTATMSLLHQTPLENLIGPFTKMAGEVVNASSVDSTPKNLTKTPKREALLAALRLKNPSLSPELAWFVLENDEFLTLELFELADVQRGLAGLEGSIVNGLRINRMNELFHLQAKTASPQEALLRTLDLIKAIFGNGKAPWWFREDIDFEKLFDTGVDASGVSEGVYKVAPDREGLDLLSKVARPTGPAFEYGLELYKKGGWRFVEAIDGLPTDRLWGCYGVITQSYGIGNVSRACNVARFMREFLEKVPAPARSKALEKLERHAKKAAPSDAIIGRLQGEDAGLHLPGLSSLLVTQLGADRMEQDRVDSSTITVTHLTEMATRLARPVQERARELPGAIRGKFLERVRLLTDHTKPLELEMAVTTAPKEADGMALLGLLELYEQFERECNDPRVAEEYFTFYAHKMTDPLRPPEGFFEFLERFRMCSDPRQEMAALNAPHQRGAIREKNASVYVERRLVIGNLIDAWTKGLITLVRFQEILNSVSYADAGDFAENGVVRDYEGKAKRMVKSGSEEDGRDWNEDVLKLFARYLCLRDSVEVIAVHSTLVDLGVMTPEDLKELTTETALDRFGRRAVNISQLARGEKVDTLLPCMRAMVDSGCVEAKDLRGSLHEATLKERFIYSHRNSHEWDKRRHMTPDFFTRLEELWYASYCFHMMHQEASKSEYRDHAISEIKRHLAFGHFQEDYMRGEVAVVVEGLISDAAGRLHYKCDELSQHATIFIDRRRFMEQYFPLQEIGKIFFKVWYELLHRMKIPDSVVIHLIEQVPHTIPLEGQRYSIAESGTSLQTVSPLSRFIAGISVLGEKKEAPRPKSPVGNVTDKVISMVTFTLALTEIPRGLLGTLSVEASVSGGAEKDESTPAVLKGAIAGKQMGKPEALRELLLAGGANHERLFADVVKLKERMGELRPSVMETIRRARENAWGLVPVGGKIHVLHPVDEVKFDLLKGMMGFNSTQFRLDQASTSILIPPVPSAEESAAIVNMLARVGVLDDEHPELQITLPGRLPPEEVAVLGSFVLLATERGTRYDMKAFSTTHDHQTGARIMAYDAGHRPIDMPFMPKLEGRTDMLGRRHAGDIKIMQRVGTVLLQAHAGKGPFARFAPEFKERYRAILRAHGIEHVLKGNWIFLPEESQTDEAGSIQHYETVKACTDAYFDCVHNLSETGNEEGIIFEVRALLEWLEEETTKEQKRLRESGETCAEETLLLSL